MTIRTKAPATANGVAVVRAVSEKLIVQQQTITPPKTQSIKSRAKQSRPCDRDPLHARAVAAHITAWGEQQRICRWCWRNLVAREAWHSLFMACPLVTRPGGFAIPPAATPA